MFVGNNVAPFVQLFAKQQEGCVCVCVSDLQHEPFPLKSLP